MQNRVDRRVLLAGVCAAVLLVAAPSRAAVTASVTGGGTVLSVDGDGGANAVGVIIDDGQNEIEVIDGGSTVTTVASFPIERIRIRLYDGIDDLTVGVRTQTDLEFDKKITIDLGKGDDVALIEFRDGLSGDVLIRGTLEVELKGGPGDDVVYAHFGRKHGSRLEFSANMGSGNDECRANLWGDVSGGGDVDLDLRGGAGDDILGSFSVFDTRNYVYDSIDITGDSTVSMRFRGNGGNDEFQVSSSGSVDGRLVVGVEGASGVDTGSAKIYLGAGSGGTLVARGNGGTGDDALELGVYDNSAGGMNSISATLNGSGGTDTCTSTPLVVEFACEA